MRRRGGVLDVFEEFGKLPWIEWRREVKRRKETRMPSVFNLSDQDRAAVDCYGQDCRRSRFRGTIESLVWDLSSGRCPFTWRG